MTLGPANLSSPPPGPFQLPQPTLAGFFHDAKHSIMLLSPAPSTLIYLAVALTVLYSVVRTARPFYAFWQHYRVARTVGLPLKLIPFPPGLFSFFLFQILRRLGLLTPGTELHKLLTMGRPDSYELHKEMGDVFLTVSPAGITMIVADPKVASHINGKRAEFPKPPNTGAIINIYGRNVINADGDVWRLHRRVTGPVFSERIHSAVWDESIRQANFMVSAWPSSSQSPSAKRIPNIGEDTLRLGLNVITGAAYGTPLAWSGPASEPPLATPTTLSYRESLDQLTQHLMPLFLTPRWLLRMAPLDTTWGRAWQSYTAFGSYMAGMMNRAKEQVEAAERGEGEEPEDNLLTALLAASRDEAYNYGSEDGSEKGAWLRPMTQAEVTGNMFIMLFAGHETSANTLHYALVSLALNPGVQREVMKEVDEIYRRAEAEGRDVLDYERDFGQSKWIMAVMSETLRVYSPTGMTNKWSNAPSPITFNNTPYVIPAQTRISINGTGIHFNPRVWGEDCTQWLPQRWIIEENPVTAVGSATPASVEEQSTTLLREKFNGATDGNEKAFTSSYSPYINILPPPSPDYPHPRGLWNEESPPPSVPPTPSGDAFPFGSSTPPSTMFTSTLPSGATFKLMPAPLSASSPLALPNRATTPTPASPATTTAINRTGAATSTTTGLLKPAKGTYLPFSEGARMCSGRKFASVEFYAVLCVLLRRHRLTLDVDAEEGEGAHDDVEAERVRAILRGRKPGAVTLQPPEVIPLRFVPRRS